MQPIVLATVSRDNIPFVKMVADTFHDFLPELFCEVSDGKLHLMVLTDNSTGRSRGLATGQNELHALGCAVSVRA